jgi:hypothetical protein
MREFSRVMLVGILMTCGCDQKVRDSTHENVSSDDVRRDVKKAADTAANFSEQSKEEFKKGLDDRLKALESEIAKLREKGNELMGKAKDDWAQRSAELEIKRDAVLTKLDEVSRSTAEAWKDVQEGAQTAWDELDKAFRQAAKEF